MTPVIFKLCEGQVTAVFPREPGSYDPWTLTVYAHVGQHGIGSVEWARDARSASPAQYAGLLSELRRIGYADLKIRRRMTRADHDARRSELRRVAA